jgi:hypothetical protein
MIGYINVGGTWKALLDMHGRVAGVWQRSFDFYKNVGGTWQDGFRRMYMIGTMTKGQSSSGTTTITTTAGYRAASSLGSATFQNGNPYTTFTGLFSQSKVGAVNEPERTFFNITEAQIAGITKVLVMIYNLDGSLYSQAQLDWQTDAYGLGTGYMSTTGVLNLYSKDGWTNGVQRNVYVQYLP